VEEEIERKRIEEELNGTQEGKAIRITKGMIYRRRLLAIMTTARTVLSGEELFFTPNSLRILSITSLLEEADNQSFEHENEYC